MLIDAFPVTWFKTSLPFAFAQFIDYIINISEDVALLRRKGIIEHALGNDEEVSAIFKQLIGGTLEYQTSKLVCIRMWMNITKGSIMSQAGQLFPRWLRSSSFISLFFKPFFLYTHIIGLYLQLRFSSINECSIVVFYGNIHVLYISSSSYVKKQGIWMHMTWLIFRTMHCDN